MAAREPVGRSTAELANCSGIGPKKPGEVAQPWSVLPPITLSRHPMHRVASAAARCGPGFGISSACKAREKHHAAERGGVPRSSLQLKAARHLLGDIVWLMRSEGSYHQPSAPRPPKRGDQLGSVAVTPESAQEGFPLRSERSQRSTSGVGREKVETFVTQRSC